MSSPAAVLDHVPGAAAYALVAMVVMAESALLLGVFAPTLTLLLTTGAMARADRLDFLLLVATAAAAATLGDFLGHRSGGVLGERLRTGSLGRRIPAPAWRRAEALMARHGGRAVFVSRFTPVVRTLTPHLAGAMRLPYRRVAPGSALSAVLWATAGTGAGYAAAESVRHTLVAGGPVLATAAVVAWAGALLIRRRRGHSPARPV